MQRKKVGRGFLSLLVLSLCAAGPAFGQLSTESLSLNRCQRVLASLTQRQVFLHTRTVGRCLDTISTFQIGRQSGDVSFAAKACLGSFRRLVNSDRPDVTLDARFLERIRIFCDPNHTPSVASHDEADVLGSGTLAEQMDATNLNSWCGSFGGDGTLDSFDEWASCILDAVTCEARQQLATQYPRMLEWLAAVRPHIDALDDSNSNFTPLVNDALTALDALDAAADSNGDDSPDIGCGPALCGNGTVETGEDCDFQNLNGQTCVDQGFFGGELDCAAGCVFDTSNCQSFNEFCNESGAFVSGQCWLYGAGSESCDTVCGNSGLVCDEATTRDFAGSGPGPTFPDPDSATLNSNCETVLDALSAVGSGSPAQNGCGNPVGCSTIVSTSGRLRCDGSTSGPTTCAASTGVRRACACDEP